MTTLPADIVEAMTSEDWWQSWFRRGDWRPWQAFLRCLFGLPLLEADRELIEACTGTSELPAGRHHEADAIVGRRGGKTRILALIAAWLAIFDSRWSDFLDPGEQAFVLLVAKDQSQASVAFGYLRSLLVDHPLLAEMVISETSDALILSNRVVIRVASASFRGLRGYAVAALIADEVAFWLDHDTSANPAEEVIAATRPAMLQFGGRAMLLCASSPYRKTGPLWDAFKRHYGRPSPVLVWKAPTTVMNSAANRAEIDRAYEEDAQRAAAEYGGEFRQDLAPYIDIEAVEAVVAEGRRELAYVAGVIYAAFCDPSGGSSDSMTLAISHVDRALDVRVLDLTREIRAPFSPAKAVQEFAGTLKAYKLTRVCGDRYASQWPVEGFRGNGIEYIVSEKPKSLIYQEALPLLNSGKVELLDDRRLVSQIASLERRTARGGRDSIDHPAGGRDDLANAALGALVLAGSGPPSLGDLITDEVIAMFARRDWDSAVPQVVGHPFSVTYDDFYRGPR
jgi:hypothetical protein